MQSRPHGYGLFKWSDTDCMEVDRDFQEELGASEALSIVPGRRERKDGLGREREREEGKRHSTNDVIMEKIEPEALSLPPLFGFASHPNRRSFRGALQAEQALE